MVANANWLMLPPPNCICPLLVDYKVDETWNVSDFFLGWSGQKRFFPTRPPPPISGLREGRGNRYPWRLWAFPILCKLTLMRILEVAFL